MRAVHQRKRPADPIGSGRELRLPISPLVHQQLGTPLVWVWDTLPVHLSGGLTAFIAENKEWLTVFRLPACPPDLNRVEGVWSLVKRSLENFTATGLDHLIRVTKRKPKKIQYCPCLLHGCLAETGLTIELP
ncbi:transposase [Frankia sp. Cj5]|uniref:transposase n=1 Tax=Frankia sp. Cj5 TaxID=2880978 RepID=UPI001EF64F40|nr:transposase [Frankia sp. Cj5]